MGKTVTAVGDKVTFNGSDPVELNFKLMGQAEDVTVKVVDSSGNSIREFKMGALTGGTHRVDWDGLNKHGEKLNSGNYKFEVIAKDAKNAPVSGVALIKGVINGVRYENGNAVFLVNDSEIQFNKVMDIMTTEEVSDS
jgi:flagellar hook assembly protein FlgD